MAEIISLPGRVISNNLVGNEQDAHCLYGTRRDMNKADRGESYVTLPRNVERFRTSNTPASRRRKKELQDQLEESEKHFENLQIDKIQKSHNVNAKSKIKSIARERRSIQAQASDHSELFLQTRASNASWDE
jgi:Xaa-Pro aminopeptidase